ncbi:Eco57I restriction-modification methylase domain-containing protein [Nocardia aobensis]|uniref:site-specific DNA-methyltransferase (adenine-specific) n=1 Tax=Nocardia aobensis TaxID=257277 RepID=A0ABW6P4I9_9NOCA
MRGGREQPAADRRAGREPGGGGARKRHGRHYTPPRLAEFLAERTLAHVRPGDELSVLDPACGDGELLSALAHVAAQRFPDTSLRLVGYDLNAAAVHEARARGGAWNSRFGSWSQVWQEEGAAESWAGSRVAGAVGASFDSVPGTDVAPPSKRVVIDWRVGDFLCAATELTDAHFDAVITNPPYVRTQQLGGATAQMLSKQFGLSGRIDLTHPFVATIPRLLRPGGVLGLLCANRFLSTKAGANLRALLYAQLTPVELYDLGDTRLFEAAVLPAVTIAVRGHEQRTCRFVTAYESEREPTADADLFDALVSPADSVVEHGGRRIAVESGTLWTGAYDNAGQVRNPAPGMAPSVASAGGKSPSSEKSTASEGSPVVASRVGASRPAGGVPAHRSTLIGREYDAESGLAGHVASIDRRRGEVVEPGQPPADVPSWTPVEGVDADVKCEDESLTSTFDPATPWRMSRPDTDEWLARIAAGTWRTFGEVARIRVGIKTNADRVFISDQWEDRPCCPEPELLQGLLTHHDLVPWRITRAHDTRVLYPYDASCSCRTPIDLNEYPRAAAYLAQHKDTLAARDYLTGTGREWFEIWVPQRPHLWCRPKVVFPDISVAPRFALDRSGAVVNGDCYWMSLADIGDEHIAYLLMGVANSTLGLRFYDAVCGNRLYAGRRRWITQYVTRLPLPDPNTGAGHQLTDLARELANGGAEPDAALLDRRVAAAFGLGEAG